MYVVGDRKNCVKKDKDEEGFVGRVWLNRCPVGGFFSISTIFIYLEGVSKVKSRWEKTL